MKKILLALTIVVSSLSFASVDGVITPSKKNDKFSTLICKVRNKAVAIGQPGIVRLTASEAGQAEVNIDIVRDMVEGTKEVYYDSEKIELTVEELPQGFVKNKLVSFKKVSDQKPFAQNDQYFVYLKKSFPSSVKVTVISKETGVITALPKCYVNNKFLTKIIKL